MGQTESTLLNILVNHWREVRERGENLSVVVKKDKLVILCFSKWSTFRVGWSPVGTFNLQVIKAVEERVFRPDSLGHSDQVLYRVTYIESSGGGGRRPPRGGVGGVGRPPPPGGGPAPAPPGHPKNPRAGWFWPGPLLAVKKALRRSLPSAGGKYNPIVFPAACTS